jgi:hypothetical protein
MAHPKWPIAISFNLYGLQISNNFLIIRICFREFLKNHEYHDAFFPEHEFLLPLRLSALFIGPWQDAGNSRKSVLF